jgi:hypothetical protein
MRLSVRALVCQIIRALALLLAIVSPAGAQQGTDEASGIGYPTVAAALDGLQTKPGVTRSVERGWTVFEDRAALTIWSFAPPDDPAYPSAVRRTIIARDGSAFVNTRVLCEAAKPACDRLVESFNELNRRVRDELRSK